MNRFGGLVLIAGLMVGITYAAPGKVAPDISQSNPYALVDVIVQFQSPSGISNFGANVSSVSVMGQVFKQYTKIQGVQMKLPAGSIAILKQLPFIKYISPNRKAKARLDISTSAVNANTVWSYGYDGNGVGVAVIDSGVNAVADLA